MLSLRNQRRLQNLVILFIPEQRVVVSPVRQQALKFQWID